MRALEARCLALHGRADEARQILAELMQRRGSGYVDAYHLALLLEALGDHEAAFHELQLAVEENSASLIFLGVDPKLDPLRGDSRFRAITRKLMAA